MQENDSSQDQGAAFQQIPWYITTGDGQEIDLYESVGYRSLYSNTTTDRRHSTAWTDAKGSKSSIRSVVEKVKDSLVSLRRRNSVSSERVIEGNIDSNYCIF